MGRKLIGQSMVEAHLMSDRQLENLLEYQKRAPERTLLGKLSLDLGIVEEDDFAPFIASYFNVPYLDLKNYPIAQKEAIEILPEPVAKRLNVMPLQKNGDTLTVAVFDPMDLVTLENIETVTGCHVKPVVSAPARIRHSIAMSYGIL